MWRSFFTEKNGCCGHGVVRFYFSIFVSPNLIDVQINEWYKGFYDLLQKATERDISEFYDGIFLFMKLAVRYDLHCH